MRDCSIARMLERGVVGVFERGSVRIPDCGFPISRCAPEARLRIAPHEVRGIGRGNESSPVGTIDRRGDGAMPVNRLYGARLARVAKRMTGVEIRRRHARAAAAREIV